MRAWMICATALTLATPAWGATADDAKTVLDGQAMLKSAEASCGRAARLSKRDTLALTYARAAAEQALPISQFQPLDGAAQADAASASQAQGFCADIRKKRSGLMSRIRKAGDALAPPKMTS